jgi:hypothetical protein
MINFMETITLIVNLRGGGKKQADKRRMGETTLADVRNFLRSFKRAVVDGQFWVVNRSKNNATLSQLGLRRRDQEDIILDLTPADYYKGPEPDRDKPGDLWFFGPDFNGRRLYIKLKLVKDGPIIKAKCLSFHLAEHTLTFPFADEGG